MLLNIQTPIHIHTYIVCWYLVTFLNQESRHAGYINLLPFSSGASGRWFYTLKRSNLPAAKPTLANMLDTEISQY
jgi:hypothetical protein